MYGNIAYILLNKVIIALKSRFTGIHVYVNITMEQSSSMTMIFHA